MRERKYVKLRVDMYEDTKFKIIDMKPERDVIYYIWSRIVLLAGKVNLEGELYLSKSIPYTIETLAIEFNRDIDQIKLALDIFMELEMLELIEDNVYRVRNFVKHQNIKVKQRATSTEPEVKTDTDLKESLNLNIGDVQDKKLKDKTDENAATIRKDVTELNLEIAKENEFPYKARDNKDDNITKDKLLKATPLNIKKPRNKTKNKKVNLLNNNIADEIVSDETICDDIVTFTDGYMHLNNGGKVASEWSFG